MRNNVGDAVAWGLRVFDGEFGMAYTLPEYRRRNLNRIILHVRDNRKCEAIGGEGELKGGGVRVRVRGIRGQGKGIGWRRGVSRTELES